MKQLRETPVRDLTREECRRLLVHNHGGKLTNERRLAYLFKSTETPEIYFATWQERDAVIRSIESGI